uniref:Melanoma antigen recognized by T-cells 1 n=1 Tax=Macrostomum lignano TaxID=282301 RepID=A0A1I8F8L6_9PLAT
PERKTKQRENSPGQESRCTMRTGQVWVFLEIGLGVVFIITLFCLCRFFDMRKSRRRKNKAKAADEDCYQRQLAPSSANGPCQSGGRLNQDCSSWTLE